MPVQVCVAIREDTTERAVAAAAQAAQWADLVEVRADYIRDLDLGALFRNKPCPMIFTLRASAEGGDFRGPERNRLETILAAARSGADFVDIELSASWKTIVDAVARLRVILSHHLFEGVPEDLNPILESMAATGAGVLKIATTARRLVDNLAIAGILERAKAKGLNLCALAMGIKGVPSRILGPYWGSWMTFACLPGGEATAEGQIAADVLVNQYRVRQIGSGTRVYGVLGRPLGHSLSPQLHNVAFAARDLDAVYLPLEADTFDDFLRFHASIPVFGASVTIPYKEAAYASVRSLSVEANDTRAVNTLVLRDGGWHGENTDVAAFVGPLLRRVYLDRMQTVVLGAGGAARAAAYALKSHGASVCVVSRNPSRGRDVAEQFQAEFANWDQLKNLRWKLLVNATPVGMSPDVEESPVPADWLHGEWVYDLVYNPRQTRLLKDAALRGCRTISGIEMFLNQALKQHQLWCGTPVPEQAMRGALQLALDRDASAESY